MADINGIKTQYEDDYSNNQAPNLRRLEFMDELLKVLQNTSYEVKNKMIQIKKDARNSKTWWAKEKEEIDKRISDIIKASPWTDIVVMMPDIMTWLKLFWEWDYENALLRVFIDEKDEYAKKICERFVYYAESFIILYQKQWTEYLRKYKKIPNYRTLLKACFCKYIKRYMETYLRNMEFSEEECKEGFSVIQEELKENWLELEASENIKQSFINLCREKYPLAKKSCDFLFENKSFKRDYLNMIIKSLDKQLSVYFDDVVHDNDEMIKERSEKDELSEDEIKGIEPVVTLINIIAEINGLMDEWTRIDSSIALYFSSLANVFEEDHNKKLKKKNASEVKNQKVKEENSNIGGLISNTPRESWKTYLSEEESNLVKQAVWYLNLGEKEWSVIKYITKLKMKDLPLKFHDFKRLFEIKEIPPQVEAILIDKLWLEYEVEEEVLKIKEEEKIIEEGKKEQIEKEEIIIDNPKQFLIEKMESLGYIIDNKNALSKQLDEFLQNDNYAAVLKNHLKNPEFLKVFLHKWGHSAARVIRVWMTGRRLLFEKKKDDKFYVLCFANHNNYEDRLAKIKNRRRR